MNTIKGVHKHNFAVARFIQSIITITEIILALPIVSLNVSENRTGDKTSAVTSKRHAEKKLFRILLLSIYKTLQTYNTIFSC